LEFIDELFGTSRITFEFVQTVIHIRTAEIMDEAALWVEIAFSIGGVGQGNNRGWDRERKRIRSQVV
jgi:hypothetical protein